MVGSNSEKIKPGPRKKILIINQGKKFEREITMAEVRLEWKEIAFKISNAFVVQKKQG